KERPSLTWFDASLDHRRLRRQPQAAPAHHLGHLRRPARPRRRPLVPLLEPHHPHVRRPHRPMIDAAVGGSASAEMITLVLPDGATRTVAFGTPAHEVVGSIGKRLLRDSIAVAVDGVVQDLNTPLRKNGKFVVITEKDPRALDVLRHSGAHILATAVRRLRPDAKIGFGPAIEDGFYYDFEVAHPFTPDDLA